jgi:hypothetical protein
MKSPVKNHQIPPDYYHQSAGYGEAATLILLALVFVGILVFGDAIIAPYGIQMAEIAHAAR